jgi:plasmid stabilization system protein ParE
VTLTARFRLAARREFEDAATAYEAAREGLGRRFVDAVDETIRLACDAPQRYRFELRDVQRIRVRHFPYTVYFRVRARQLVVLAVFHFRRDPAIWRERA